MRVFKIACTGSREPAKKVSSSNKYFIQQYKQSASSGCKSHEHASTVLENHFKPAKRIYQNFSDQQMTGWIDDDECAALPEINKKPADTFCGRFTSIRNNRYEKAL
jgi:hypothetical protein